MTTLRLESMTDERYQAYRATAEAACRELGVRSIGLNVFGFNRGAQSLYEQQGYEVTSIQMRKRL